MKTTLWLGHLAGVLLVLMAAAHAFAGWPDIEAKLTAAGVAAADVGGVAAGWIWGSVAMLAFGVVLLASATRLRRGAPPMTAAVWSVAGAYLAFGVGAWLWRDHNPHFLGFVAMGLLIAAYAGRAGRAAAGA